MKVNLFAFLVATAVAQTTTTRCLNVYKTTSSLTRCPNAELEYNMWTQSSKFTWTVKVQTVLDEDTGAQYM